MKKVLRDFVLCFSVIIFLPVMVILDWYDWVNREVNKDLDETKRLTRKD